MKNADFILDSAAGLWYNERMAARKDGCSKCEKRYEELDLLETMRVDCELICGDCLGQFERKTMNIQIFDKLVERETQRMKDVMCSKSADYADGIDKLFNFKLAAELDGISPIEALRGMWLKHRSSIRQALDELLDGKSCRPEAWWIEKLTDDRNYSMLLQGLLTEKYFKFVVPEGWVITKINRPGCGWHVMQGNRNYLWKDFALHRNTTGYIKSEESHHFPPKYGEAPGYWPTEADAKAALQQYLEKQDVAG